MSAQPTHYRIKAGVRPYGGRTLKATRHDTSTVTGWVEVSRSKVATAQRTYRLDELEPLPAG